MSTPWPPAGTRPLAIDVVSIQSQVVYGRVGNNVALPTLAALGLSTAAVPTVTLSNTPHYASLHGGATPVDWFSGWLGDLVQRGALKRLKAVLCGYLGSVAQAEALAPWLEARAALQPHAGIVIDPVIGDHDHGVYVDPGLVELYRERLLPLAIGATPNEFELARLTGCEVTDTASAIAAARPLLRGRLQWIAVTSTPHPQDAATMQVTLVMRRDAWAITHPRIDAVPKGTGDLFSAALAGHWVTGEEPPGATVAACAHVLQALRLTAEAHCAELLLPTNLPSPESTREITCAAVS
jgi:pyridoxine kinase